MNEVRLGLLGCGRIVQLVHLEALARLKRAKLVAVAEPHPESQQYVRTRAPDVDVMSDYMTLLRRSDLDAVVICLPTGLHVEAATEAFERDKHLYLEKPIATNLADARSLLDIWSRNPAKRAAVGFHNRFHPLYQQAKQIVQSDKLGRIVGARVSWCSATRQLPNWKRRRKTGGGVLLDLGSHLTDIVQFLFERPVCEVTATVDSVASEEDNARIELRLNDGMTIQAFLSCTSLQENRLEIYGERRKLVLDRQRDSLELHDVQPDQSVRHRVGRALGVVAQASHEVRRHLQRSIEPAYDAAFQSFVDAIIDDQPVQVNLDDGYRSLVVIHAAEESARIRRPVAISEIDGSVMAASDG